VRARSSLPEHSILKSSGPAASLPRTQSVICTSGACIEPFAAAGWSPRVLIEAMHLAPSPIARSSLRIGGPRHSVQNLVYPTSGPHQRNLVNRCAAPDWRANLNSVPIDLVLRTRPVPLLNRSEIRSGLVRPNPVTPETSIWRAIRGNGSDRGWFHANRSNFVRDGVLAHAPSVAVRPRANAGNLASAGPERLTMFTSHPAWGIACDRP